MSATKANAKKTTEGAQAKRRVRAFHRRRLPVSITVADESGAPLIATSVDLSLAGLRATAGGAVSAARGAVAQLELPGRGRIRAGIQLLWSRERDGRHEFGARFTELDEESRAALAEAIFGPLEGVDVLEAFDDAGSAGDPNAVLVGRKLPASHHHYYVRLIRRLQRAHGLSDDDADRLLFTVLHERQDFTTALLALGLTTFDRIAEYLGRVYGVPYVALETLKPDVGVAAIIPEHTAVEHQMAPVRRVDGKLVVAMADPTDLPARDIIHLRTKGQFELNFALLGDVEKLVRSVYQAASLGAADPLIDSAATDRAIEIHADAAEITDLETLRRLSDATPIISLVDSLLRSAVEERASDIHLEPMEDAIIVRFRLDGVLHEMRTLPRNLLSPVVSRIKVMANMDITERVVPQDGRISMRYGGKDFELRVASLPTVFGESVVVRLLEKNPMFKTMRSIGFSERNYQLFAPLIRRPFGMILFCGPTGSGKSTTLFSCIQEVHDGTKNVITVEDPVEYRVRGIKHMELNVRRGVTFPTVLRSVLRGDPDVIYVGEIRDRETADLAVRAALTGHLLFSTLHTNSAIQAISRLVDIGVEGTLIGASLLGVVGQRLLRRICDWCKEEYAVAPSEAALIGELFGAAEPPKRLMRGRGCSHCHKTGFYGRLAVHEVVVIDERLRHLIGSSGTNATLLRDYLGTTDFQDLRADAVDRLVKGETTLQEVIRVTV